MNNYQSAISAITAAKKANRLTDLKREVLKMSGIGEYFFWHILSSVPSRYTKAWARLNRAEVVDLWQRDSQDSKLEIVNTRSRR